MLLPMQLAPIPSIDKQLDTALKRRWRLTSMSLAPVDDGHMIDAQMTSDLTATQAIGSV